MEKIAVSLLLLAQVAVASEESLVISPVTFGEIETTTGLNIAEGISQLLDLRFLSCSENNTESRNLTLHLIEGADKNLHYPELVYNVPCRYNETFGVGSNATISGGMIGFVTLQIKDEVTDETYLEYSVGITRPPAGIETYVYQYGVMVLITITTFTFGISLDLEKVLKYLKKPVAPGIGIICQFILMPLLGFVITLAMTSTHEALKLGIFTSAVAPGGGLSNIWVFVLNGDLDLSITMTFISTIAAVVFIPLWMYTLGQYIIGDAAITLPFADIATSLALLIVPITAGLLINRFLPKVARKLIYLQKPVILILIIFACCMSTWVNMYAFEMVLSDVQLSLCSFLLPYAGGLFGFLIAMACQQGKKLSLTIGIETAIQNTNIAMILLRTTLPQPWADLSSAIPIVMVVFTFTPFPFFAAGKQIYLRCIKKKEDEAEDSSSTKQDDVEMAVEGVDNSAMVIDDDSISIKKEPEDQTDDLNNKQKESEKIEEEKEYPAIIIKEEPK